MENSQNILNGPIKYILIIVVLYFAIYIPYYLRIRRKNNELVEKFLSENPFPAKIYFKNGPNIIAGGEMSVHSVNGKDPVFFFENLKSGFYAAHGENEISLSYSWTKPGILKKNITTEISQSRQVVTVEAGKEYILNFDREANQYTFTEIK